MVMSGIKAVGFDYGGVIGGVGSTGVNFTKQISEILGVDEATYKDVYFGMNHKINTGEIESWHEFWKLFVDKIGKPEKYDAVLALSDEAERHLQIVDEKMLVLADHLRRKGYRVGLLSNTTAQNGKKMRGLGVDKHFDVFHISAETKLMKPSARAYLYFA
jgi:FMN phosphatase YigB (HAD superfamily)